MKKLVSQWLGALLIFTLLMGYVPTSQYAATIQIKDIQTTDESYEQIEWVIQQGYMGLTLSKFLPNSYVKRNEFSVILSKINGDNKALKKFTKAFFLDVPIKDQFFKYIENEKHLITYTKTAKGNYFKPLTYLTREDACMSIVKVLGYDSDAAAELGLESDMSLDSIVEDANKVSPALLKYVALAVQNQLIDIREAGDQLFVDPKKNITRKQLAVFIYNAYQAMELNRSEDTETVVPEGNGASNSTPSTTPTQPTTAPIKPTTTIPPASANVTVNGALGNTTGNLANNGYFVKTDAYIFFANTKEGDVLYRANLDGTNLVKMNDDKPMHLNAMGGFVYYVNRNDGNKITKIDPEGGNKDIFEVNAERGMIIQGDWIYFIDKYDLSKMKLDGTEQVKIMKKNTPFTAHNFAVSGNYIFYRDYSSSYLYRLDLLTNEAKKLNDADYPNSICIVGDWVYYSGTSGMYKIKTDGTKQMKISNEYVSRMNVVGGMIYYLRSSDNKIYKVTVDGAKAMPLHEKAIAYYTRPISIIDQKLYFDSSYKAISFIPLDGSAEPELFE